MTTRLSSNRTYPFTSYRLIHFYINVYIILNHTSNHITNILIYFTSSVSPMSSIFHWLPQPRNQSIRRCCQFEGENKGQNVFKTLAYIQYLVNNILQTNDISSNMLFDKFVWIYMYPFFSNLSIHFLVDELSDDFRWRFSVGDIILYLL